MQPTIQVNDFIEGEIQTIAFGGEGILRHKGFVIFIPFTAPEDFVRCQITEVKKSFAKALLIQVLKPGPRRIEPFCPYFGTCGGCQLQHLDDLGQQNYKLGAVKDALLRIGHLHEHPVIVPALLKRAYRRHITVHLRPEQGFFTAGFIGCDHHSLVVIETCPIFNPEDDSILEQLQAIVGKISNPLNREGRVTILKSESERYILSFRFDSDFKIDKAFFSAVFRQYPLFTGIIVTNEKHEELILGDPFTEIQLEGLKFRITPRTFIQNHPEQSANIYRHIAKIAGERVRKTILDLYCGFGISSLLLARKDHSVCGVEYNREAIDFA